MKKPRRKPRYCRFCGKALKTSKTGRWFFCAPPDDPDNPSCAEQYAENHEPDVDPAELISMSPTDEDNCGNTLPTLREYLKTRRTAVEEEM